MLISTIKIKTSSIFLLLFVPIILSAQTDCSEILKKASEAYSSGNYELVVDLLKDKTSSCKFDKSEREQALKILTASYLSLDEIKAANKYTLQFLRKNPVYKGNTITDPLIFISNTRKYNIRPRLSIGIIGSIATQSYIVKKHFTVWQYKNYSDKTYNMPKPGVNVFVKYNLSKRLGINTEIGANEVEIKRKIAVPEIIEVEYIENWLEYAAPLYFSFDVLYYKKFTLSVMAGGYLKSIRNSTFTLNYEIPGFGINTAENNINSGRMPFNGGYLYGVELRYTRGRLNYFVNYKAMNDAFLMNIPEERYNPASHLYNYNMVDNDILGKRRAMHIGLTYTLFYKIKHKYL